MDIYVYDSLFSNVGIIDNYSSLLWVQRYSKCGDFELIVSASDEMVNLLSQENYLHIPYFDRVWMIIESVKISTDAENGDSLVVSGRSFESILDRRIIFPQTVLDGAFQTCVRQIVESNIGVTASDERKIANFIMDDSADSSITSITSLKAQFTGASLYEAISELCDAYGLGYYVTFTGTNFVFQLYSGLDRSIDQNIRPPVIFSPDYESLMESMYHSDTSNFKNVAYVNGIGEGTDRKHAVYDPVSATGLGRRELYVDARDISNVDGETTISDQDYQELLITRGTEKIIEHLPGSIFEASPIPDNQFVLNRDYNLGDIVTVQNEYGISSKSRVTEIIFSDDEGGIAYYPTFELIA